MSDQIADYTWQIAQFAAEMAQSGEPLPATVADVCRDMMLNAAAAALAGAAHPDAIALTRVVRAMGGNGRSTIIGMGQRTSPVYAALVNGMLIRLLDFDDNLPDDLLINAPAANPTAAVFPAVMALGEMHGFTGHSVLNAFAVGCEVIARLSSEADAATAAGSMGAATAASMLLTPDAESIASAVGLAASAGNADVGYSSASAAALTGGNAAMHGVMAALMASEEIVGAVGELSHQSGAGASQLAGLGRDWRLTDPGVTVRMYPCHPASHGVIDAVLGLSQLHRFGPSDVAAAHVGVAKETLEQLSNVLPVDGWQARASIGFIAAATLCHGQPLINFFSDAAVRDEGVRAMMERVSVEATLTASPMSVHPAEVAVTLNDGQTLRHRVDHARGTPAMPLDAEELEAKFLYCTRYILPEDHIEEAIGSFRDIAEIENVTGMVSVLGG
ncbi:MAG: MmgE/PrpD family protein [Chloroflexi bacterium]|nr:MmgE/PrpD family protein [Chloroflexota bacterium]MYD47532.1 MmgE/PrpD family protein [Chloroflexota bacterium]